MVGEWKYSSPAFKFTAVLLALSSGLICLSFFTPYWLQSYPTQKLPNPKFSNLGKLHLKLSASIMLLSAGLWHACFNGFHDKGHQYEVRFYGCKHVLLEEYDIIRGELIKRE